MTVLAETPDVVASISRCDRCGARARVQVLLAGGRDLLFCGHHAMAHQYALERVAVWVEDVAGGRT